MLTFNHEGPVRTAYAAHCILRGTPSASLLLFDGTDAEPLGAPLL